MLPIYGGQRRTWLIYVTSSRHHEQVIQTFLSSSSRFLLTANDCPMCLIATNVDYTYNST